MTAAAKILHMNASSLIKLHGRCEDTLSACRRPLHRLVESCSASSVTPGGNVTGMAMFTSGLGAKNLELLKDLLPTAAVIAYLLNPSNPSAQIYSKEAATAATALGIQVPVLNANTEHDLDETFASLVKLGAGGLAVTGEPFCTLGSPQLGPHPPSKGQSPLSRLRERATQGGSCVHVPPSVIAHTPVHVQRRRPGDRRRPGPVISLVSRNSDMTIGTTKRKHITIVAPWLQPK